MFWGGLRHSDRRRRRWDGRLVALLSWRDTRCVGFVHSLVTVTPDRTAKSRCLWRNLPPTHPPTPVPQKRNNRVCPSVVCIKAVGKVPPSALLTCVKTLGHFFVERNSQLPQLTKGLELTKTPVIGPGCGYSLRVEESPTSRQALRRLQRTPVTPRFGQSIWCFIDAIPPGLPSAQRSDFLLAQSSPPRLQSVGRFWPTGVRSSE
ncbi:unnamed protein product [Mesocestoides corti]|uniref:Uncharacterized protein n=1 Tax=Mesocestoides corti TaxID=53468 RepID=A0A0R3U1T8_MESCO|nr:unnamed protein product [Mesocestoides corti]